MFEMNLDTQELRNDGTLVKLSPQPFRLLEMLASHAGQIVTREEIQKQLWGDDTFVDFERGVHKCINQIRNVLNDNPERPVYIETLPRKGYRFLVPVTSKRVLSPSPNVRESGPVDPSAATLLEMAGSEYAGARSAVSARRSADVVVTTDGAALAAGLGAFSRRGQRRLAGWLAFAAVVLGALLLYWHSQKANALMEKDTVILADFANSTGEPVFDDTLRQGLRIQLEQSPLLNLVTDQKVNATLKLMGRSAGERLTPEATRDLCQRVGSKAMLTGSIAQLGTEYVIGVQAVNCSTGELLAEALEPAKNKEDVLKALDRAAVQVRRKLGESLKTVQNFATPLEEATTPSLEALKAYSLGAKASREKGAQAGRPYYERAIQLDPNFALAYMQLAVSYLNSGEAEKAIPYLAKAYELREHASERERLIISALYYHVVTCQLDNAAQYYQQLADYYPRDYAAFTDASILYGSLGRYDKAIEMARRAQFLSPESVGKYDNLVNFLVASQQFHEAQKLINEAEQRKLDSYQTHVAQYTLGFLDSNLSVMEEQQRWFASNASMENFGLSMAAETEAYAGRLSKSRELSERAVESAQRSDNTESAATWDTHLAIREAGFGNYEAAQQAAAAGIKLDSKSKAVRIEAALAYAMAHDSEAAELIARDLNVNYPVDVQIQSLFLPAIQAQLALNRSDPAEAINQLQRASPPIEYALDNYCLWPTYIRGQAYLAAGQGAAAAAEFKKILDHSGLVWNCWTGALARLGSARASALQARSSQGADADAARARALADYKEFLTLWKDADPDIPIYQQARAEYAKLQVGAD
jgi:DNA-binding winged helix-turn-helix (wHTH) protein/tetratricopeptide (TPR) repeat protein